MSFTPCPDCGSAHLGGRCGLTFAQRIRTVRIDPGALETRSKRNYFDAESVADTFGEHARDELLDATDGLGVTRRDRDGTVYHQDRHSAEWERVSDERVEDVYLGAGAERDYDVALDGEPI